MLHGQQHSPAPALSPRLRTAPPPGTYGARGQRRWFRVTQDSGNTTPRHGRVRCRRGLVRPTLLQSGRRRHERLALQPPGLLRLSDLLVHGVLQPGLLRKRGVHGGGDLRRAARERRCLSRDGNGDARQRQCLSLGASSNTRQMQCLSSEGSGRGSVPYRDGQRRSRVLSGPERRQPHLSHTV